MPVIKSAIKKLKQDKNRQKLNDVLRDTLKSSVKNAKKSKTGKSVAKAISIVDKAAKKKIIHPNKASRMKAGLSKIAKPANVKSSEKTTVPAKKKVTKKVSALKTSKK